MRRFLRPLLLQTATFHGEDTHWRVGESPGERAMGRDVLFGLEPRGPGLRTLGQIHGMARGCAALLLFRQGGNRWRDCQENEACRMADHILGPVLVRTSLG